MCDHFSCYDDIISLGLPLNVTATLIGNGLIQLSWIPSNGGWIGSFLDCIVLVKDGNGVVVHNETVRNSQLIINTSDPCSQYYATVAPVCQGTVSVASIGGSQIPGGNITSIKLEVWGGKEGWDKTAQAFLCTVFCVSYEDMSMLQ